MLPTMGVPSPWDSRPLGDPAFTLIRRSVCLGLPFVSLRLSLQTTHHQELFTLPPLDVLVWCRRFRYVSAGVPFLRWKLGFNQFRFNLYLFRDFLHTGLAVHHTPYLRI